MGGDTQTRLVLSVQNGHGTYQCISTTGRFFIRMLRREVRATPQFRRIIWLFRLLYSCPSQGSFVERQESRGKLNVSRNTLVETLEKLNCFFFFLDFTIQPATRVFLANTYQDLINVVFTGSE